MLQHKGQDSLIYFLWHERINKIRMNEVFSLKALAHLKKFILIHPKAIYVHHNLICLLQTSRLYL